MYNSNIDFTQIIITVINNIFNNLFTTLDNSIYSVLDDITFIDSAILYDNKIIKLFGSSNSNGVVLISLSLLFGFVLYYCIKLFYSYYFSNTRIQSPMQFFIRAVLIAIFINFSYSICKELLDINSIISLAIRNIGEYYLDKSICFSELVSHLNDILNISNNDFTVFSLDGIIKSITSVGFFNLIFSYSLRFILLKVLILISPFTILTLLLDSTSWIFKSWLKCFLSLLLLQSFVSIILLVIFSLTFSTDVFSKIIYVGSIYALIKSNNFMKELFGGISTDININISNFKNLIR